VPRKNPNQSNNAVLFWSILLGLGAGFCVWIYTDFHPFGLVAGFGIGNAIVGVMSFFGRSGKLLSPENRRNGTIEDFNRAAQLTDVPQFKSSESRSSVPEFMPKPAVPLTDLPLHVQLIEETKVARTFLGEVATLETGEFGDDLKSMVANVDVIIAAVYSAPIKLPDVQRLFTYYLPEVSRLLEARQVMKRAAAFDRVGEIDAIIDRIAAAFHQLARRIHEADIRALDIDLKLLDRSLAAEFETQIGT
jgi:hypothetical protein